MVLDPALLTDRLTQVFTTSGTESSKAEQWADALRLYTAPIVYVVLPPAQDAAKIALQAALLGFNVPGAAHVVLDTALSAYAATLALGMIANGATGATPPLPGILAPQLIAQFASNRLSVVSASVAANGIATIIHTWFLTGTYLIGMTPFPWT